VIGELRDIADRGQRKSGHRRFTGPLRNASLSASGAADLIFVRAGTLDDREIVETQSDDLDSRAPMLDAATEHLPKGSVSSPPRRLYAAT